MGHGRSLACGDAGRLRLSAVGGEARLSALPEGPPTGLPYYELLSRWDFSAFLAFLAERFSCSDLPCFLELPGGGAFVPMPRD